MKFAFITRHSVTDDQIEILEDQGHTFELIGDLNAFAVTPEQVSEHGKFDGVIVVHPAAAMRLQQHFAIGVFENASRAAVGEKPDFKAVDFHVYE